MPTSVQPAVATEGREGLKEAGTKATRTHVITPAMLDALVSTKTALHATEQDKAHMQPAADPAYWKVVGLVAGVFTVHNGALLLLHKRPHHRAET